MVSGNKQTITREACAWIARLDASEPTEKMHDEFRLWMAKSPEHAAEIKRLSVLWGELNILTELAVPQEPLSVQKREKVTRFWPSAIAGAVIAATVLLSVALLFNSAKLDGLYFNDGQTYITAVGEQRRITLDDGSTMLLNTNSEVEVRYDAEQRRIHLLSGQAHFDVQKDPVRPFLVYTSQGVVKAVGTAFSVYLKNDGIDVTVTEGTVEFDVAKHLDNTADAASMGKKNIVRNNTGTVNSSEVEAGISNHVAVARVTAGQRATAHGAIASIETIEKDRLEREQSWQEGVLRFSGEPLERIVTEISRYTQQTIIIEDPQLRTLRLGGVFKLGETEKLFSALESGFGVQIKRSGDKVILLSSSVIL